MSDPSTNEPGRLPDDMWDGLPDEAKGLIRSLQDNRGDAAKFRTQLREVETERDALKEERDTLSTELTQLKENQPDVDAAVKDAVDKALAEHQPEVLKAKVKAAAATVLAHPDDAVALIDWDDVDPGDDDTITTKINEFVEKRPDLKAQRSPTSPPRGPQGSSAAPKSWAREIAKASR